MAKVITFSRVYPSHHPRAGEPTFFVEKIHEGMKAMKWPEPDWSEEQLRWAHQNLAINIYDRKYHTIRAGNRFNPGDWFSPRVWSGKPYHSKQIIIAPNIEVKKTFQFEILNDGYAIDGCFQSLKELSVVAKNDGLEVDDFECWFNIKHSKYFNGQIICWNENINY
jgi:hypothetical protein